MSFSDYWEDVILDLILEDNLWVGLSTANPLDDATGLAEPVGNGYARVAVTTATWDPASGGSKDNGLTVTFIEASGGWGTVTYFCLFDAETLGNLLMSFVLSDSKIIVSGDIPRFSAGQLVVNLD